MDCRVHGVAKSRTRLSDFHLHFIPTRMAIIKKKKQEITSTGENVKKLSSSTADGNAK